MNRHVTIADSFGVGSIHVGLKDLASPERRAIFQLVSSGPFLVEFRATLDFDFVTNVGTNWYDVTPRVFTHLPGSANGVPGFEDVGGSQQRKKPPSATDPEVNTNGLYAFDDGFMPSGFQVNVTSVTSGSPLKILFGV